MKKIYGLLAVLLISGCAAEAIPPARHIAVVNEIMRLKFIGNTS